MKKLYLLLAFISAFITYSQSFVEVDGIKIEKSIKVSDGDSKTKLHLNGYGIRDKMWINLYVQALYLDKKSNDPNEILNSPSTIATRLYITSNLVTRQKLIKAIEEGIEKSYKGDLEPLRDRMHKFMSLFEGEMKTEGYVEFIYSKNTEKTYVYANEELLGEIDGADFRKALFGIWLEERAVDRTLKKRLLGK